MPTSPAPQSRERETAASTSYRDYGEAEKWIEISPVHHT